MSILPPSNIPSQSGWQGPHKLSVEKQKGTQHTPWGKACINQECWKIPSTVIRRVGSTLKQRRMKSLHSAETEDQLLGIRYFPLHILFAICSITRSMSWPAVQVVLNNTTNSPKVLSRIALSLYPKRSDMASLNSKSNSWRQASWRKAWISQDRLWFCIQHDTQHNPRLALTICSEASKLFGREVSSSYYQFVWIPPTTTVTAVLEGICSKEHDIHQHSNAPNVNKLGIISTCPLGLNQFRRCTKH